MTGFLFGFYCAISLIIGFVLALGTWLPDGKDFNRAFLDLVCCTVGFAVIWPLLLAVTYFDRK